MPTISLPSLEAVYIEMYRDQLKLAAGTAFVCDTSRGSVLVSNWHNFSGRNNQTDRCISPTLAEPNIVRAYIHLVGALGKTVPIDFQLMSTDGCPLWIEHPIHGHKVDVAVLPISVSAQHQLFPVSWRNPIPLMQRIGIPAKVIGYPFGKRINEHMPVWATGHLASEPEVDVDNLPLMLIDCRTRRGNSGSPVMLHYPKGMMYIHEDESASFSPADVSRLLGIYSGRISVGSDIGRVWKLSAIKDILATLDVPLPAAE